MNLESRKILRNKGVSVRLSCDQHQPCLISRQANVSVNCYWAEHGERGLWVRVREVTGRGLGGPQPYTSQTLDPLYPCPLVLSRLICIQMNRERKKDGKTPKPPEPDARRRNTRRRKRQTQTDGERHPEKTPERQALSQHPETSQSFNRWLQIKPPLNQFAWDASS